MKMKMCEYICYIYVMYVIYIYIYAVNDDAVH